MGNITTNPAFLALALRAQSNFAKARRMDDGPATAGTFAILDMLDMLDAEMKPTPPKDE